ncbi:MAG: nucleotidyltransferase domain-containing protein [Oscillospiraceae bacterium]|jgi:predicted nucleotidyltransferase|nr:nucleotidyltransferase domain-containing protein [Oscillospiraceae bacterium]
MSATKAEIDEILKRTYLFSKGLFGERLCDVILFGSYARGDYDDESDVDIMVVADFDEKNYKFFCKPYNTFSTSLAFDFDIYVSLMLRPKSHWDKRATPLIMNILKEGVRVSV